MSAKTSRAMMEQQIFLGGQISHKFPIYKLLSRMEQKYSIAYWLMKHYDELKKEPIEKIAPKLIYLLGISSSIDSMTELTRLSMILGDTRKHFNVKGIRGEIDELLK